MDFGIYLAFENPKDWEVPTTEVCAEALSQVVLAEELGYDTVWIAEHHFGQDWFPSSFTLLGAMAALTHQIKLGQSVTILPLYHPVHIAENAAVVDVLSNGRFQLGLGLGYHVEEFSAFGIPRRERVSRMEEGLEIIKGCFLNEMFSFEGRHYKFDEVNLWPRPVQKPHPPMWVAAVAPKAAERAARFGCHLSATSTDPEVFRAYDDTLRDYGRDPKDFNKSSNQVMYVAETREKAWYDYAPHLHQRMAGYAVEYEFSPEIFKGKEGGAFGMETMPSPSELAELSGTGKVNFFGGPLLVGTVEDVMQGVEEAENAGVTHLQLWMQIGGIDPRKTRNSMRLFANEVMPHFKNARAKSNKRDG